MKKMNEKMFKSFGSGQIVFLKVLILTALFLPAAARAQSGFNYQNFASTAGLNLTGNAAQSGNVLRLTTNATGQQGTAFYNTQVPVTAFNTSFQFQISGLTGGGADGFSFNVRSGGPALEAGANGESGTNQGLAVQFDTFQNTGEPNGNFIRLRLNGTTLAENAALPVNLKDGNPHTVALYVSANGQASLLLDGIVVISASGVNLIGSSPAYVGFGARTGGSTENHDILKWSFTGDAQNLTVTNTNNDGAGSLRAAVTAANANTDNDAITFDIPPSDAGCANGVCTIRLTSGELSIADGSALFISGTGANRLAISGNNASRVFYVGPGANVTIIGLTITNGNGSGSTFSGFGGGIFNSGTLSVMNASIYGNTGSTGGGIISNGNLTVMNSTVSGNVSGAGGGLRINGTGFITNSTISGNSAGSENGGGVFFGNGSLVITYSTITSNSAGGGGGVTANPFTMSNSIVSGNSASFGPDISGRIDSQGYNLIGNNSGVTINGDTTGNILNQNARVAPLGFYGGTTQTHALLSNSPAINSGNSANAPAADQRGASRIGNTDIGAFEVNNAANGGSFRAVLPAATRFDGYYYMLSPNNGSTVYTLSGGALPNGIELETDPATNGVVQLSGAPTQSGTFNFSVTATNAGNSIVTDYTLVVNNAPQILTVTKTTDSNDGACNNDCSLREAIAAAAPGDEIQFAQPPFNTPQTITLSLGELTINKNLFINNPLNNGANGAHRLSVSANNASRVFNISQGAVVTLNGLTVTGGNAADGGGILVSSATLNLNNCAVSGNRASGNGGGIYNVGGTTNVTASTISGNTAGLGGGIANGGAPSVLNVTNSTVSGNVSNSLGGGGIFASGAMIIRSSTITNNRANGDGVNSGIGGGIANYTTAQVSLGNTIVAGNFAATAPDFRDTLNSLGHNLIGSTSGTIITGNTSGNVLNQNAGLLPLLYYAGGTQTHALLPNSPAINAGTSANAPATDQRGRARVGAVDIGAFETGTNLVVTNTEIDGAGSLRQAVITANSTAGDETISFNIPASDSRCSTGVCIIGLSNPALTNGQLSINSAATAGTLTITNAGGSRPVHLSGGELSRVFFVNSGAILTLDNLTVTKGRVAVTQNYGGGIYNDGGALNLISTTVSVNNLTGAGGSTNNRGAGIYNLGGALVMLNSTVSNNTIIGIDQSQNYGAGIYNLGGSLTIINSLINGNSIDSGSNFGFAQGGGVYSSGSSTLTITNSTVSNNSMTGGTNISGGGIFNSGSPMAISNSTISGNSVSGINNSFIVGGGIYMFNTTLTITNSTVTRNSVASGDNMDNGGGIYEGNTVINARNTIVSGNTASNNANLFGAIDFSDSSIIGNEAAVRLAPLGYYGGPMMTHPLLSGSSALNTGNNCVLTESCPNFNAPVALTTDQRGAARVGQVDIGAFELNNSANGGNFVALLPTGTQNAAYNWQITPNNGAFTYSVTSGTLPNGVNLTTNLAPNAVVALTGTPMQGGAFDFAITASDGTNSNVTNYRLQILAPTAASVSVSGRVMSADGRGLRNAIVTMTDSDGATRSVRTSAFGYYRFDDLQAGQTIVVSVISKRFQFISQVVTVNDELTEIDFVAQQ